MSYYCFYTYTVDISPFIINHHRPIGFYTFQGYNIIIKLYTIYNNSSDFILVRGTQVILTCIFF